MAEATVWGRLDNILDRFDSDFKINVGSGCAWSGFLRLTLTNPDDAPSRSITFFSAGGGAPEHVAEAVLSDAEEWLRESGTEPMPVPRWMTHDEEA